MGEMQAAAVQRLHLGSSPVVIFVAGGEDDQPWLAPVQLTAVRDRFREIHDAMTVSEGDVFSFAYDGWIEDPLQRPNGVSRREALLMVGGTRWGDGEAVSIPYTFEEGKGVTLQPHLAGPDGMVENYLKEVFGDRLVS